MATTQSAVSYHNRDGTLTVYRGYFPREKSGEPSWFKQVQESLSWSKHTIHGNHDRLIWDGKKVGPNDKPEVLNKIGKILKKVLNNTTIGAEHFANWYKNGENRTFWHRDFNLNPNESVVMVSFGATRTLTFVDYCTDEEYPVALNDGDIVVFDFKWNFHTFHAVEKTMEAAGERISLQFFQTRDVHKWTQSQIDEWHQTEPKKRLGIIRRREKVNKVFALPAVAGIKRKQRK